MEDWISRRCIYREGEWVKEAERTYCCYRTCWSEDSDQLVVAGRLDRCQRQKQRESRTETEYLGKDLLSDSRVPKVWSLLVQNTTVRISLSNISLLYSQTMERLNWHCQNKHSVRSRSGEIPVHALHYYYLWLYTYSWCMILKSVECGSLSEWQLIFNLLVNLRVLCCMLVDVIVIISFFLILFSILFSLILSFETSNVGAIGYSNYLTLNTSANQMPAHKLVISQNQYTPCSALCFFPTCSNEVAYIMQSIWGMTMSLYWFNRVNSLG